MMPDLDAFAALENAPLWDMRGADWDAYLAGLRPWLDHEEAEIRRRALNRLALAVLEMEPGSAKRARREGVTAHHDPGARLNWLLDALEAAHLARPDVIPVFLSELRFSTPDEAMRAPLRQWLGRLREAPPGGVDPLMVEGIIVLHTPCHADDPAAIARVVALLDHPSNYVRSCAARSLSGLDGDGIDTVAMFALVQAKEIERPGIAGPYWSEWHFDRGSPPVDPIAWMMDILTRRVGQEPTDMPFNGVDFYLHELCDHSPDMVERMIEAGHADLAVETATEADHVVPGMEPVLRRLAEDPDKAVRSRARRHLAAHYDLAPRD
jgi:hypothetical protein